MLWLHWPDSGLQPKGEPVYEAGVQLGRLLRTAFLADYFVKAPFRQGGETRAEIGQLGQDRADPPEWDQFTGCVPVSGGAICGGFDAFAGIIDKCSGWLKPITV